MDIIIEDMVKCLDDQYFKVLLSKEWLTNDRIINTIIETSNDYMADLTHLRPESLLEILVKWHNRIKVEYMKGFLQKYFFIIFFKGLNQSNLITKIKLFSHSVVTKLLRKCQFTEPSERQLLGNKMTKEIGQLEHWFESMAPNVGDKVVNIRII